jgi:hypothetical protein
MWHAIHLMIQHESFSGRAHVNWPVIHMNDQLFRMKFPRLKTEFLVKQCQHIDNIALAVHFSVIMELTDNMEPSEVPRSCEDRFLDLNVPLHNCCHIISGYRLHSVRRLRDNKSRHILWPEMLPSIARSCVKIGNHVPSDIFPFLPEIVAKRCGIRPKCKDLNRSCLCKRRNTGLCGIVSV